MHLSKQKCFKNFNKDENPDSWILSTKPDFVLSIFVAVTKMFHFFSFKKLSFQNSLHENSYNYLLNSLKN